MPSIERAASSIFGAFVPNDAKAVRDHIDASPLAPTDPAAREAIFAHASAFLGQPLPHTDAPPARTASARPTSAFEIHAQHVAAAIRGKALVPVITPARAQQLYAQIAAAPDIPHQMIHEGCHFRAHIAAKRIEQEGVYTEKVWIRTEGDLQLDSKHSPIGYSVVMFHNAVMVYVDTGGLEPERWVIDPSVCEGAAPLAEWASHMRSLGDADNELIFSPRFVHHIGELYRDTPSGWVDEALADSREWAAGVPELEKYLEESNFLGHLEELVEEAAKRGASRASSGASRGTTQT